MGLSESKIVTSNDDEFVTVTGLLKSMLNEDSEILTIILVRMQMMISLTN